MLNDGLVLGVSIPPERLLAEEASADGLIAQPSVLCSLIVQVANLGSRKLGIGRIILLAIVKRKPSGDRVGAFGTARRNKAP
jgi:hypothetical protein